jgi:HD-GYP domain-containing protein (c-di-GMP phosphodiesterase class II)
MNLVIVNVDSIRIGQPLPFSLRDESGILLAHKGYVVNSREELELVIGRRSNLYIDVAESESHHRAYVGKLYDLVREERPLRQIAGAQISSSDLDNSRDTAASGEPDWLDLQTQTHAMLRDSNPASFRARLDRLQAQLGRHSRLNPDGTLFALIHLSATEIRLYSATHAMLVSVMCRLAAREVLKWPEEMEATLCNAALTMNLGMTELQDRLVAQREPPNPEQRRQIDQHASHSVHLLEQLGVQDPRWLEAVLAHHTKTPGPLAGRTEGQRMARLIQRADMFAARLAPRVSRLRESPAAGMQASYFDENRQIDEAGAALIKAVGIYSPGSFVRLATNEIAVVIKRGANTTTPRVAILINRAGMPTGELIVRDTSQPEFRIVTGVAHADVKVKINLERLLLLTKSAASDRLW